MNRLLIVSLLVTGMLVPASAAYAASTPQAPVTASAAKTTAHADIAGGAVGSVPGVVAISTFSEHCTGAVIAPDVVLTAAHCLADVLDKQTIRVLLDGTHQNLGVARYYRAPGFNPTTHYDDAAVLILKSPSKEPALQITKSEPAAGTDAVITGYGQQTYTSAVTAVAYSAFTRIQSFTSCRTAWAEFDTALPSSDICAQNNNDTVTRGDSGGPLLVKSGAGAWRIAGINDLVVVPNGAYDEGIPQAFGRVDQIRPWIEGMIARFA